MKYLRHFFVEGKFLGTAPCGMEFVHELTLPPEPIAYFCPHCAEIWARAAIETLKGARPPQEWRVLTTQCRKHPGSLYQIPGSLDMIWQRGYLESFPDDVVRWEFQRQIEHYFKG